MILFHKQKRILTFLLAAVCYNAYSQIQPAQQSWKFDVFLDGTAIGYHQFFLVKTGAQKQVTIKAEFDVQFLFFSVYDYVHENSEIWNGDCLMNLTSKTTENGEQSYVRLRADADKTFIDTPNSSNTTAEKCVRSFAYWNPDLLKGKKLLNSQTGELVDVDILRIGKEVLTLKDRQIESERYRITGKNLQIDLWYSDSKHWLALQSTTEDGYLLRYELQPQAIP